jgi:mannose-6-phosphate isomerase
VRLLDCAVRNYAWGSRTALAEIRGREIPSPHPEAEMWMGAHPADPSYVLDEAGRRSLLELVQADPDGQLGVQVRAEHGARLPFLMKLLAAEEPLSLQAHPSAAQAVEGFARENRANVPLDSPGRNYKDDNHKPELIVALGPFEALAGFRPPDQTVRLLAALNVPEMAQYAEMLAAQPDAAGLRALFTTWITLPQSRLQSLLSALVQGCVRYLESAGQTAEFGREARTALELAEFYPGDAGVLAALLLNRVSLEPGQGIYLDAGNLHAYLRGVGVEIMANSDNVLRGGLTPKHVDVAELLRVVDFAPVAAQPVAVRAAHPLGRSEYVYDTPAPEFRLSRIELDATGLHHSVSVGVDDAGPQILVCTNGAVTVDAGGKSLELRRGQSMWLAASDPAVVLHAQTSNAQVFRATVGSERSRS